ncbi:MAG: DUF2239 family protein [Caulobacteraceae bacterium]
MVEDANAMENGTAAFVAFAGTTRVAAGTLAEAAVEAKRAVESGGGVSVLVFSADTGRVVDLDLRGTEGEVLARHTPSSVAAAKRGRPKLGVVAREVTLLPRHWEWLARQPSGASVALRKLVEAARKVDIEAGPTRARAEAAYRFMSAMAGDLPRFEDATRSLFAGDRECLRRCIQGWPIDIRDQVLRHLLVGHEEARHA